MSISQKITQIKDEKSYQNLIHSNKLVTGEEKILVIGANGQVGHYLIPELEKFYKDNLILTDIREGAKVKKLDASNTAELEKFIKENNVAVVINLAAFLSSKAEDNPELARKVNVELNLNLIEIAKKSKTDFETTLKMIFTPSSIASVNEQKKAYFAKPNDKTNPYGVYGKNKKDIEVAFDKAFEEGIDARMLRYAGVLTCQIPPSDGTTEELDRMIVAAAELKAFNDLKDNISISNKGYNLEYSENGVYYPKIGEESKFPMIDASDIARETIRFLHIPKQQINFASEYFLSATTIEISDVVKKCEELSNGFKITFDETKFSQNKINFEKKWSSHVDSNTSGKDWGMKVDFDNSNFGECIENHFKRLVDEFKTKITNSITKAENISTEKDGSLEVK